MSKVIPFCGLRYNKSAIDGLDSVTAPPFEILSEKDENELCGRSEYNINRITSHFKSHSNTSERDEDICGLIKNWEAQGIIKSDGEPALYVYEQAFRKSSVPRSVRGIFGLVEVEDYGTKIVLPNERISTAVNNKILNFWENTHINICPVWSFYSDGDAYAESIIMNICERQEPTAEFTDTKSITHRIWAVTDSEFITNFTEMLEKKQLYIAEGHHKYETALRFRDECREKYPDSTSDAPFNYTMMLLMAMEQNSLEVVPTHRMIKSGVFDENTLINNLTMDFSISKIYITDENFSEIVTEKLKSMPNETLMGLYTGGNYYYLLKLLKDRADEETYASGRAECFRKLDVTVMNSLIIDKHLTRTVDGERVLPEIAYTHSADEALSRVRMGEYSCAVLLNPTKLSELKEISLANERLPQNAAYFMPKPLNGLVMNKMEF